MHQINYMYYMYVCMYVNDIIYAFHIMFFFFLMTKMTKIIYMYLNGNLKLK